jgi:zinc protease
MKNKIQLFVFVLMVYAANAQKNSNAGKAESLKYISSVEGIKEYSLTNGLKVLLVPDASQSNMIVNIIYNVGSRHEGYGEKGMAHLLEHMLFKSTKNLGDIKTMLSSKGGNANGTTWLDRTNYYEIFPSSDENLKWSLAMEADRMINATILQTDLDKEFSVVRNEFEIGENNPGSVLQERIISSAYLWHNYGNSTIGSKEDIERVKAARLRLFYEKYYQPDNATLIIGGKFDERKALTYISQYFAKIKKPTRILEKTYTVEPAQDGERFVELKRNGDIQVIAAAYHTAPFADKDAAAVDALSEIITGNPSGYLYKALIETQKASAVYSWQPQLRDASFLYFNLDVPKDKSLDEAKKAFLSELDAIATKNYTDQDVVRAKSKILKYLEDQKNNTINFTIGLTEIIGAGDYRLGFLYRDAIENLTVADINRVAKKYFKSNNRTYGVFIPEKKEERVKSIEISDQQIIAVTQNYKGKIQEQDEVAFETSISNIKRNLTQGQLKNGFKYALVKKAIKGKKVIASFKFPVGNLSQLLGKSDIASTTAKMLLCGTSTMNKEQIQDQLDQMKTSLSFYFSEQSLIVTVNTYQEFLEPTFDLLQKIITDSNFPENELVKTITEQNANMEVSKNDPQSIVFREVSRISGSYPKDHIFYVATPEESIASLKAIKREQLIDFYQNILGANHGVGTIIGNLKSQDVEVLFSKTFDKWISKAKYEKVLPVFAESKKRNIKINTPDKENAAIAGGVSFEINKSNSDYPALVMVNEMLGSGGFLTSRIPIRLREKEGISYGAGSFLDVPVDNEVALLGVYAFFNPTKVTKVNDAIEDEITKVLANGFTTQELNKTIVSWKNDRTTSLGNDNKIVDLVNSSLYYGNSLDDFDFLEAKVNLLSVEQINAVLRKYISLDKLSITNAGDFVKKE